MDGWMMDERIVGWMGGWDGLLDGWLEGWMDRLIN